jgi:hypothetical protein
MSVIKTLTPPTPQPAAATARLHQLLFTLGKAYLQRQQYAEAYEKLKELMLLGNDSAEIQLDAAIAACGMNNVSDEALALYQQALLRNPDAEALKKGLPTLFINHNVTTSFAIDLCEKAADSSPENEHDIRLYLKKYYEAAGLFEKAVIEEQRAIFSNREGRAIRAYLEGLWWDDKFSAAHSALRNAPRLNGSEPQFKHLLALTHAYEHVAYGTAIDEAEALGATLSALSRLAPADSAQDFSDYLVLRACLPEGDLASRLASSRVDAHQLPLDEPPLAMIFRAGGKSQSQSKLTAASFDMRREVLELLKKPEAWKEDKDPAPLEYEGIMLVKVLNQEGIEAPEKVQGLLNSHLLQLPDSALRVTGEIFFSLAKDPLQQLRAIIDFMQSLEEYNAVAPAAERFRLIGSMHLVRPLNKCDHRTTLNALIDALHLIRHAERSATSESDAGTLLLLADEDRLAKLKANGINLIFMDRVRLLPGKEVASAELIWRNPLAQLKDGQVYEFGRFAIHQRLLRHSSYGTYLATDVELDRPTAMKIVFTQDAAPFQQKEGLRGRLFERIRSIARLSHPYLAFIYDMGERDGILYVAREYVEGKQLLEITFHEEHRDGEILVLLQKIVRALLYAKSKGVAHLNLKPGNIWLSEAQDLRITDFRIPGFTEDASTASVLVPAHWRYAAPEILMGEAGDTRSDIYSIGVIAYELIAGRHPYATATSIQSPHDLLKARIAPLSGSEKPHHKSWEHFVSRAMQRTAEKRFQDLTEMDNELRNIQIEMLQRDLNGR